MWYGVPGDAALSFEAAALRKLSTTTLARKEGLAGAQRSLLGKTSMFPPSLLLDAGVPTFRAVQSAGEFVITFPRAYHGGFSTGESPGRGGGRGLAGGKGHPCSSTGVGGGEAGTFAAPQAVRLLVIRRIMCNGKSVSQGQFGSNLHPAVGWLAVQASTAGRQSTLGQPTGSPSAQLRSGGMPSCATLRCCAMRRCWSRKRSACGGASTPRLRKRARPGARPRAPRGCL